MNKPPFWERKTLDQMSTDEWESLCDGCGRCCLHKLEDEESGEIAFTAVACELLDLGSCRCSHYSDRCTRVPDCIDLRSDAFNAYHWLPSTCAYRRLYEGRELPAWHPLLTGDPNSVHDAGVSVRSYAIKPTDAEALTQHIIEWLL